MTRLFRTAAALLIFALPACNGGLRAAAPADGVTLAEVQGNSGPAYRIQGTFEVAAPRAQVWGVLTDYDGLKGVVSTILGSKVIERQGSLVLVEQTAVGRFLFFSRTVKLRLLIEELPQSFMAFTEVSGKNFRHYAGSWILEDAPSGSRVRYELNVSSADMAPPFIEKGLFKDNALGLLRELKAEIVRRAAAQAFAPAPKKRS